MDLSEIMALMDGVARILAAEEPREWPGWVSYLLEALGNEAEADEYRTMLEAVKRDIDTRLELGRW